MKNEEQIINFIERELTPEQERALMDECAASDEMRGLLKQHVSLSRNLAATLSAIAIPVAATGGLEATLASMRAPQPSVTRLVTRRAGMIAAAASIAVVGFIVMSSMMPKSQTPAPQPTAPVVAPPTVVAQTPTPIPVQKPAPVQRHFTHRHDASAPVLAEKVPAAASPTAKVKSRGNEIQLGEPDAVK